MVDRVISLLVIDEGSSTGDGPLRAMKTTISSASQEPSGPRLHVAGVQTLEAAAAHLQQFRVDAVLLDHGNSAAIARLQSASADLPILAVAEQCDVEYARQAIGLGAEDVLLPEDLTETGLRYRTALAVARKAHEKKQRRHARKDQLTGLANTALLEERFARALARADRFATLVGLVAIDIDGADGLVEGLSQEGADELLAMIGQRLLGETRQMDTLARTRAYGFTWLVEGLSAIDDVETLVNRMPKQLERPFSIQGQDLSVTASVGIALAPFHGRSFRAVHAMAEAAMFDVWSISGDALLMPPIQQTDGEDQATTAQAGSGSVAFSS
jgi:diguanylate cyclase (GGDEF)-like protein